MHHNQTNIIPNIIYYLFYFLFNFSIYFISVFYLQLYTDDKLLQPEERCMFGLWAVGRPALQQLTWIRVSPNTGVHLVSPALQSVWAKQRRLLASSIQTVCDTLSASLLTFDLLISAPPFVSAHNRSAGQVHDMLLDSLQRNNQVLSVIADFTSAPDGASCPLAAAVTDWLGCGWLSGCRGRGFTEEKKNMNVRVEYSEH